MFIPMDPELARSLIKGHEDVIAKETKAEADYYGSVVCPVCGESGSCKKVVRTPKVSVSKDGPIVVTSPFSPNKALPQGFAQCTHCDTDFDPRNNLILRTQASIISSD